MGLDTYFRGDARKVAFCAGGNQPVVVTAFNRRLAEGSELKLRAAELEPVLAAFRALPESERQPEPEDPGPFEPPACPVPEPPVGGLVLRGYCAYTTEAEDGEIARARQLYYRENPDAWAAETQSDVLWLTEDEWKSLLPAEARPGATVEVAAPIRERFFGTIGIDCISLRLRHPVFQGHGLGSPRPSSPAHEPARKEEPAPLLNRGSPRASKARPIDPRPFRPGADIRDGKILASGVVLRTPAPTFPFPSSPPCLRTTTTVSPSGFRPAPAMSGPATTAWASVSPSTTASRSLPAPAESR